MKQFNYHCIFYYAGWQYTDTPTVLRWATLEHHQPSVCTDDHILPLSLDRLSRRDLGERLHILAQLPCLEWHVCTPAGIFETIHAFLSQFWDKPILFTFVNSRHLFTFVNSRHLFTFVGFKSFVSRTIDILTTTATLSCLT